MIRGRVQGVGYRAWMIDEAARLGLRGWVRNRHDGMVEALAIGRPDAVSSLIAACREGPSHAAVDTVEISDVEDDGSSGFRWVATV